MSTRASENYNIRPSYGIWYVARARSIDALPSWPTVLNVELE